MLNDWQKALNKVKTTTPYPNCYEVWLFTDKHLSVKDPKNPAKKRPVLILHNDELKGSRDRIFLNIVPFSYSCSSRDRFTIPVLKSSYTKTLNNFEPKSCSYALTLHYQPVLTRIFSEEKCYCVGSIDAATIYTIRKSIAEDVLGYKGQYDYDYDLEP